MRGFLTFAVALGCASALRALRGGPVAKVGPPRDIAREISPDDFMSGYISEVSTGMTRSKETSRRDSVPSFFTQVAQNVKDGLATKNSRVAPFTLVQLVLVGALLWGRLPVVGDGLELAFGPLAVLFGLTFFLGGLIELGPSSASPFALPSKANEVKTRGVYSIVRHPMYAGVFIAAVGLAVTTHSFQRGLIAMLIYLLLDAKARVEEQKLLDIHPEEYSAYIEHVPERFITLSPFANKNTSKSEKKSDHHPF